MESSNAPYSQPKALKLTDQQIWKYETDEFTGVCEIAKDSMVVKCVFAGTGMGFYDVLVIDARVRTHLLNEVSVERLSEQLAHDYPDLTVTVSGRAATHGWITSTVVRRHGVV